MFFYLVISLVVVCVGSKSTEKVLRHKDIHIMLFIVAKQFKTKYPIIRKWLSKLLPHNGMCH